MCTGTYFIWALDLYVYAGTYIFRVGAELVRIAQVRISYGRWQLTQEAERRMIGVVFCD